MKTSGFQAAVAKRNTVIFCIAVIIWLPLLASAFAPVSVQYAKIWSGKSRLSLHAISKADDVYTVQILMSDTGGGHRASANACETHLMYSILENLNVTSSIFTLNMAPFGLIMVMWKAISSWPNIAFYGMPFINLERQILGFG